MMHRALAAALLATALVACSKNTQPPPASQPAPANAPLPGESSDMAGQPANLAFTVTDMHGRTARMTFTIEVADASRLQQVLVQVGQVAGVRQVRRR